MKLTAHAISRFQSRIAPNLSFEEATIALRDATERAAPLKEKTPDGQFLWSVKHPALRLVTKPVKGADLVVTVLFPPLDLQSVHQAQMEKTLQERFEELSRWDEQLNAFPKIEPKKKDKRMPKLSYTEQKAVLALELKILQIEQAALRQREKTLRHEISEKNKRKEARRLLHVAVRALLGLVPQSVALEKIKEIDPGLLTPAFYEERISVAA